MNTSNYCKKREQPKPGSFTQDAIMLTTSCPKFEVKYKWVRLRTVVSYHPLLVNQRMWPRRYSKIYPALSTLSKRIIPKQQLLAPFEALSVLARENWNDEADGEEGNACVKGRMSRFIFVQKIRRDIGIWNTSKALICWSWFDNWYNFITIGSRLYLSSTLLPMKHILFFYICKWIVRTVPSSMKRNKVSSM